MKIQCSLLIALFFIFNGCSSDINIHGVCRQQALYCGAVAGEKYPVRIAIGKLDNENHVQTKALTT